MHRHTQTGTQTDVQTEKQTDTHRQSHRQTQTGEGDVVSWISSASFTIVNEGADKIKYLSSAMLDAD